MPHTVSAVKTPDYDLQNMRRAVERHLNALDAGDLLVPGKRVVLKPNLLMRRRPEEATTTHPALVEAVVLCLQERGVTDIVIADSPGGPFTGALLDGVYSTCGMKAVAQRTGARLNMDFTAKTVTNCTLDGLCNNFSVITAVHDADVVINLPKLKTHAMTTFSGGVKNLLGCVPGLQKPELHFRFPEKDRFGRMLVELAQLVRPQLTIVDAVVAMEGDGPSAGTTRQLGWTFAARSLHALDLAMCDLCGIPPKEVPTLTFTMEQGLAPALDALQYACDGRPKDISPLKMPQSRSLDFALILPKPLQNLGRRVLSPRPVVRRRTCIGCKKCVEVCPADTIVMESDKAKIIPDRCIKCYCCHEMCPVRAIHIRRFRLLGW